MQQKIISILNEVQPAYDFNDEVDFVENGYLDSFDIVQLISALEEEFQVKIPAKELLPENFCSVAAIESLINRNLK